MGAGVGDCEVDDLADGGGEAARLHPEADLPHRHTLVSAGSARKGRERQGGGQDEGRCCLSHVSHLPDSGRPLDSAETPPIPYTEGVTTRSPGRPPGGDTQTWSGPLERRDLGTL